MNELQILNDRLTEERRITNFLLVGVGFTSHYESQVHLVRDELGCHRQEFSEGSLPMDFPRKLKYVKIRDDMHCSISAFRRRLLEMVLFDKVMILHNVHCSMFGENEWNVQVLRFVKI